MARLQPPPCPCGAGPLDACCGPLLDGLRAAASAEALMRSRYAAYALGRSAYLLATWHPDTRPASLTLEPGLRWIGLQVEASEISEPDRAIVRFTARYRLGGRAARLSETSRFTRIDGRWYYVDGDVDDPAPSSR
ncbi:MAG: zinc chelation protein SecC [Rhodocyclaceae bacterium]|nr:zinc chelation protein SecC [Rhodocyclaceae bacterium]